jgi:hypothetical protein
MLENRNLLMVRTWLRWVTENFKEFLVEGSTQAPLRVTGIRKDEQGELELEIKPALIGPPLYKTPKKVIEDNSLIKSFSQEDVRGIAYLAYQENTLPEYSIIAHLPEADDDNFIVRFNHDNTEKKFTLSMLLQEKNILEKMNGLDGAKIGFLAGIKNMLKEMKDRRTTSV